MTASASTVDIKTIANSVGILYDRVDGAALGNVWVIDESKVATCAHLVYGYRSFLGALRVFFPGTNREFGVESAMFHPRFDMKMAAKLAQVALTEPMPTLPLQQHNAVVLRLSPSLADISDDMTFRVNKSLSLPLPPRDQGLGGNLGEIDLYVVVQTITNARKEGILTICDERNHPVARIFCQNGRLLYAQYANLVNEMAVYQIVAQDLKGNFFFWTATQPNWEVGKPIARPAEMLLIESHRRTDELRKLMQMVGDPTTRFEKTRPEPNTEVLPPEIKDYTRMLWDLFDGGTPVSQLWQLANIDDCAIYLTVSELIKTKQLVPKIDNQLPNPNAQLNSLQLSVQARLAPWDKITNVYRDVVSSHAMVRQGCLLGTLREQDPWHLIHNIRLVPSSAGSPILKDGMVIGMHCGKLPPDEYAQNQEGSMQAMLWVDSVVECLKGGGENALVQKLTLIDAPTPDFAKKDKERERQATTHAGGCREVARIDCPRCGRSSLDAARFCKSCGQRLLKDIEPKVPRRVAKEPSMAGGMVMGVVVSLLVVGLIVGGVAAYVMSLPPPIMVQEAEVIDNTTKPEEQKTETETETTASEVVKVAEAPWVSLKVFQKVHPPDRPDPLEMRWEEQKDGKVFTEGDMIYLDFKAEQPGYLYLLYQGSSDKENQASLIYPVTPVNNKELAKGESFTIPGDVHEKIDEKSAHFVGLTIKDSPGKETLVVLTSQSRLGFLDEAEMVNHVFANANDLLKQADGPNGVEVQADQFQKRLLEGVETDDGSSPEVTGTIYIKKWVLQHKKG